MFLRHLWPALSAALIVFILCVIPGDELPEVGIVNFDKVVHSIMFGGLTYLFARGFYKQTAYKFLFEHYLITSFLLCTLYGGFLEILQATVSINRAGDWLDFLFDGMGALAAIAILKLKKNLLWL